VREEREERKDAGAYVCSAMLEKVAAGSLGWGGRMGLEWRGYCISKPAGEAVRG
jgi:hypothetical protein